MNTRHIDLSILGNSEIFSGLSEGALEDVRAGSFRKRFAAGDVVLRQDDPVSNLFIVVMGQLRVTQSTPEGQQIIIRYLGPGEIAGYAALSGGMTYPGSAIAVDDCHLMGWSVSAIRQLMEKHPRISMNALAIIGTRYQEMQERLRQHSTENVERRIAHTLLRLAKQAGRRTPHGVEIAFPLSRQDLAEMAGTTLHTVSRTMSGWEERGIVHSGRRRVIVTDPHGLVQLAAGR